MHSKGVDCTDDAPGDHARGPERDTSRDTREEGERAVPLQSLVIVVYYILKKEAGAHSRSGITLN